MRRGVPRDCLLDAREAALGAGGAGGAPIIDEQTVLVAAGAALASVFDIVTAPKSS